MYWEFKVGMYAKRFTFIGHASCVNFFLKNGYPLHFTTKENLKKKIAKNEKKTYHSIQMVILMICMSRAYKKN